MASAELLAYKVWTQRISFAFAKSHLFSGQYFVTEDRWQHNIVISSDACERQLNICHPSRALYQTAKPQVNDFASILPMTILTTVSVAIQTGTTSDTSLPCKQHSFLINNSLSTSFFQRSKSKDGLALMDWHPLSFAVRALRRHRYPTGSSLRAQIMSSFMLTAF